MSVDLERVFKLRLVIARLGEMDNAGWWNTKGLLGAGGAFVFRRGFPTTHAFAQARTVFAVAAGRCRELFDAPGCITLWHLPAAMEEQFEDHWQSWLDEIDRWRPFFAEAAGLRGRDVFGALRALELIGEREIGIVNRLASPVGNPSLRLPNAGSKAEVESEAITLMAAAFARSEPGKLAVPYIQFDAREG